VLVTGAAAAGCGVLDLPPHQRALSPFQPKSLSATIFTWSPVCGSSSTWSLPMYRPTWPGWTPSAKTRSPGSSGRAFFIGARAYCSCEVRGSAIPFFANTATISPEQSVGFDSDGAPPYWYGLPSAVRAAAISPPCLLRRRRRRPVVAPWAGLPLPPALRRYRLFQP
jgi:hypothetical protein